TMCGIAGIFAAQGLVDLGRLQRMSRILRHRGPDDEGIALIESGSGRALTLGGADTPREVFESRLRWSPGTWASPGSDARAAGEPTDARFDLGLPHRRLAIVDLSPGGHEPMCDSDGASWLTFNGEIYNFIELKAELESLGEHFRTTSDTE